jgi:FOG: TPR repeat, SEL1 subfamily
MKFRSLILLSALIAAPAVIFADDEKPKLLSTTGGKGGGWESIDQLQKAAKKGDPDACYELGIMHLTGTQVALDVAKALELLKRAAEAGNGNAAFRLGKLAADGEVVPQDLGEAFKHYQAAANAGVPEAQYNLGAMYASGRGVKRDYVEGLAWLIVAAKNGADPEGEQQLRAHLNRARGGSAYIKRAEARAAELLGAPVEETNASSTSAPASGGASNGGKVSPPPVASDARVNLPASSEPARIQISPTKPEGLGVPSFSPIAPPPAPATPSTGSE